MLIFTTIQASFYEGALIAQKLTIYAAIGKFVDVGLQVGHEPYLF